MIFERIRKLISQQFDVDEETITEDTNFVEDLDADSLDVVELAMSMEGEFGIPEITEEEIKHIATVADLVRYVTDAAD